MATWLLLRTAWYLTILAGFYILYCPSMYIIFVNHKLYRKIVDALFALWELYPVMHHFGDFVDPDENTIIVMNHRTRVDWNYIWIALYHATQDPNTKIIYIHKPKCNRDILDTISGGKAKIKFVLKDELKVVPGMAPPLDRIQKLIGAFGKYQFFLCLLVYLSKFPIAWHQMAIIFLSPKMKYECNDVPNACPCSNPKWDTSVFKSTIQTEWNLLCGKKNLTSFVQTLFQLGTLLGSVFFGMAADRFGRRLPCLVAVGVQTVFGFVAAYMTSFWLFVIARFIIGLSVGGTMVIGFVVIMEFVGAQYREVMAAIYQIPFIMGHMTLPLFAYFFRDFRQYQLAIAVPTCSLLSYFILLPETPRWLTAAKKVERAVKLIEKTAKFNGRPTDNIRSEVEAYVEELQKQNLRKGTVVDLFRTPNLRKNIICMSFNWLTCSYCYYGVSQYVGHLSGNVFQNVAASALVAFCGALLAIPMMKVIGRRTILIVFNSICAACLLLLAVIPAHTMWTVVCACVGGVTAFIVFGLVYLYCTELFPTVVRNAAIGFSSMMARVGSMIAPFVVTAEPEWLPPVLFAIVPLCAIFISFFLPETKGCPLMTTIEEGENFGKKHPTQKVEV